MKEVGENREQGYFINQVTFTESSWDPVGACRACTSESFSTMP